MKNLKLLVSSAFILATCAMPQSTLSAEDPNGATSVSPRPPHISPGERSCLADFLNKSPLYHQVATEHYRSSVQAVRQEITSLQQNIPSPGTDSEYNNVERQIIRLEEKLNLQAKAFKEYGNEHEAAIQKITNSIKELDNLIKENQKNIVDNPSLKGLYDSQIKDADGKIKTYKNYLDSLSVSESTLRSQLDSTKAYLKTLSQKTSSKEYTAEIIRQKVKSLQSLYEEHVTGQGLFGPNVFHKDLPKEVMGLAGISSSQLNSIHTDRLFQLFARTVELPYVYLPTGTEKEEAYLKQLGIVQNNLKNRIQEDVFCLQLGISLAQNRVINFKDQSALVEKILSNREEIEKSIKKDVDLEILKGILGSYGGYGDQNPSHLLETILGKYGLIGLYISSLEFSPATSWNSDKISRYALIKDAKSPDEFSSVMLETVLSILGRHINLKVLEKIQEKVQGIPNKPSPSSTQSDDFYV